MSLGPATSSAPRAPVTPRVRWAAARGPGAPIHFLDPVQAAVVDLRSGSGPAVVLGAPGTGKTTTLVEAVAARIERDGLSPDTVVVFAASRTAAAALRDRICARLARTVREPLARTPHAYAFGLLRRALVAQGDPVPRLISGAEQDRILAELLAGHEDGAVAPPPWPAALGPPVRRLRGFRDELRDLIMRAVERGVGPRELMLLGRRTGRSDWIAAAHVMEEYLDVTALATPGAYDPAGIVDAAARLLADDAELLAQERERRRFVVVDDAHETDPATQRLLDRLVGGGGDLLLAGDPDSTTQSFRGARPRIMAEASRRWPRPGTDRAPVYVLETAHRHGEVLRAVTVRVAERIGSAGVHRHRRARAGGDVLGSGTPPGAAEVDLLASPSAEAAFIAGRLRRLHLVEAVPWSAMAVVVRSVRGTEPLRRAFAAAGVPVVVPPAERSVRDEPAVVPFRLALRVALDPTALDVDTAVELLTGPIGAVDAVGLRRLRQALRRAELDEGGGRASDDLLVELLADPGAALLLDPELLPGGGSRGVGRVTAVIAAGRAAAARPGATAETVLWALWQAAGLADAWRRTALAGGSAGVRADRDLDAVTALFEVAARYVDRLPLAGPAGFLGYLEGQDLPADTLAERAPGDDAVALVTAQGAAGREWDVVVVAGVQEGVWPDLRLRSSLLGAQALADLSDGRVDVGADSGAAIAAARRAVLDDELRLFHVAVSRARRLLVVTAVRSPDELPSPFLDLVVLPDAGPGPAADPDLAGRFSDAAGPHRADDDLRPLVDVPRGMTLPALVAELRAVVTDEEVGRARRRVAARHLARLARAGVPGADPADWSGLPELSCDEPLCGPDEPVVVSPSKVEAFERCALRWLLEACGGTSSSSAAQVVGTLVHDLAAAVPDGNRARLAELLADRLDLVGSEDSWVGRRERERVRTMLGKLVDYLTGPAADRTLLAVEHGMSLRVGRAIVRGQVDRLERDPEGRLVVVDLKTGKSAPKAADLARHAQLGVYQLAATQGGFEDLAPGERRSGGAALVQLGGGTKGFTEQRQTPVGDDEDPDWARRLVETAADGMAGRSFPATANPNCRVCGLRRCCPVQPEGRQVGQ